jgi:hypothetical protein
VPYFSAWNFAKSYAPCSRAFCGELCEPVPIVIVNPNQFVGIELERSAVVFSIEGGLLWVLVGGAILVCQLFCHPLAWLPGYLGSGI